MSRPSAAIVRVRRAVSSAAAVVVLITGALAATESASASTSPDRAVKWSGTVAPRTMAIPGRSGGFRSTIVASFRLHLPSGGTWHVESALTATGVSRASAPGSSYGRISFGHAVECGPDVRDSARRLTSPELYVVSGTNLLYDRRSTTTVRGLWHTVRGYNRCQVISIVGRDDLAVAGKRFPLEGGYLRLVGRGLSDGQTLSVQMDRPRLLSRRVPSLTAPNFQTSYTAPLRLAIAGAGAQTPAVRYLDIVADAYVTTCYRANRVAALGALSSSIPVAVHTPACPRSAGGFTFASYRSNAVVLQYRADGSVCRKAASVLRRYRTTNAVHHQEVRNRIVVAVDPTCGSRRFRVKLYVRWTGGNEFWVERGYLTRLTVRPLAA